MGTGVTILIPAYNEEAAIKNIITDLQNVISAKRGYEILVIDDGSTDNTAKNAKDAGAKVVKNRENRGYGAALKKGIRLSKFDTVATLDGDGSYPAEMVPKLLREASKNKLVVGARDCHGQYGRRFYKFFLNRLVGYMTARKIDDANSGMRVFDRRILMKYEPLLCDGFSFSTTSTMVYAGAGLPIKFVDISYFKRKGKSKIRLWDSLNFLVIVARTACHFRPMRVFAVPGAIMFGLGVLIGATKLVMLHNVGEVEVLLVLGGLILGSLGLIADMIRARI